MAASYSPRVWLALATIYVVWGSTFMAVTIAVRDVPPLLAMGFRHVTAGTLLLAWALPRGNGKADPIGWTQIRAGFVFGGALFLLGLSGPIALFLVPVIALKWWARRERWMIPLFAIAAATSAVQVVMTVLREPPSTLKVDLGATPMAFLKLLASRVAYASTLGEARARSRRSLASRPRGRARGRSSPPGSRSSRSSPPRRGRGRSSCGCCCCSRR